MSSRRQAPGVRHGLSVAEILYEVARDLLPRDERPAIAGGRRARLVSLPPPRPYGPSERREIRRTLRSQCTSFSDGDAIARFERELSSLLGCRHAIAVSSGTAALHAALTAAGVGPGDEVIVPALTHAATALAVLYRGAVPRFVDAHAETWTLDPALVESLVTPRTKMILPVHLCGVPCDLEAIRRIAGRRRLLVVEDAAQAHGATYSGRAAGTIGDLGCMSFQSTKSITTGEGGAILTDDDALAARARLAMNLGESTRGGAPTADLPEIAIDAPLAYETLGWNYRMSALQATLGIGQLRRLESIRAARIRNADQLRRELAGCAGLTTQSVPAGASACPSMFYFLLPEALVPRRAEIVRGLAREGIDCRLPYAKPLPAHPIFGSSGEFPVAERICAGTLGFRVDPSLGRREIASVGFALRRLLAWVARP